MSDQENPIRPSESEPGPQSSAEPDLLASAPRRASYPFWNYEDLLLFLALFVPSLVLGGAVTSLLPKVIPNTVRILLLQFIAYAFWFAALWLLLRLRYERPFWGSLAWCLPDRGGAIAAFGGPLLAILVALIGVILRTPNVQTPMRDLLSDPRSLALVGTFAVTLGPVCEELAFRGFMLPLVTRSFGAGIGIVLTAIPFGLLHGQQYGWLWQQVLLVTLAGVVFGWIRVYSNSTAASTIMHATYNLTFFVGYLVQTRMS